MRREKCYFLHLSHLFDQFSKSEQKHINTYALLSNKPISKTNMVFYDRVNQNTMRAYDVKHVV